MVRVKICGITNEADAQLCVELGAHALGFNFYEKSPRYIRPAAAAKLIRDLQPFVAAVGVFVNQPASDVIRLSRTLGLRYAQLHGDETPHEVGKIAKHIAVIKALRAGPRAALTSLDPFPDVSAILLDADRSGEFGGTGELANWSFARKAASGRAIILAGGLSSVNVAEAIARVRPYAVDVASGVEASPGKKDRARLRAFFAEVNRADLRASRGNPSRRPR